MSVCYSIFKYKFKCHLVSRGDPKSTKSLHNSSSTPNFEANSCHSYNESTFGTMTGGYQNVTDQKEAFFSKKQMENSARPE